MSHKNRLKKHWSDKGYFIINLIRITPFGIPDYVCLKPNHVVFVESKEGKDKLSALQKVMISKLTKLGFECYVNNELYKL